MLLISSICVLSLIYIYLKWILYYWQKYEIPAIFPYPLIGSFPKSFFKLKNLVYDVDEVYKKYKGVTPFVGYFMGSTPGIILLDPKLIKEVLTNKFRYFHKNAAFSLVDTKNDPINARHPFFITNYDEWKEKRTDMIPALTKNKLKSLFHPIGLETGNKMTKFIQMNLINDKSHCFDGYDLTIRYMTEFLTCSLYGIESKSFESNEPTNILKHALGIFDNLSSLSYLVRTAICYMLPFLGEIYKIPIFKFDTIELFKQLLRKSIDIHQSKDNNNNNDTILNYLLELQKKKNLKTIDLQAQMSIMYLDSFVTSAQMLEFNLYFLSKYQRVQQKLRDEINNTLNNNNINDIPFGVMEKMEYLDQVFYETLRIVPDDGCFFKICTIKTTFHDYKDKEVNIEPGTTILIPLYSLSHDPEYFQNPEKFHPERFNADFGGIKPSRTAGTFFPWGDGPRICIGMRLAKLQLKLALIEIIRNFNITLNSKTSEKLIFDPATMGMTLKGGIWLNMEAIKTKD